MDSETSQPSTELNTPAPPTKDQDNRRHSAEDHPCPTPETDHPTKPAPNQLHSRKIEAKYRPTADEEERRPRQEHHPDRNSHHGPGERDRDATKYPGTDRPGRSCIQPITPPRSLLRRNGWRRRR